MPGNKALDAAVQGGARDLALHTRAADKSRARDHRAKAAERGGEFGARLRDEIALDDINAQGTQIGQVLLLRRVGGGDGGRTQQDREGSAGGAFRVRRKMAQHGHAELARAQDQNGVVVDHKEPR
ncbi:hypothetical protein D3C72_1787840 [compost metagenome]